MIKYERYFYHTQFMAQILQLCGQVNNWFGNPSRRPVVEGSVFYTGCYPKNT